MGVLKSRYDENGRYIRLGRDPCLPMCQATVILLLPIAVSFEFSPQGGIPKNKEQTRSSDEVNAGCRRDAMRKLKIWWAQVKGKVPLLSVRWAISGRPDGSGGTVQDAIGSVDAAAGDGCWPRTLCEIAIVC